MNLPAVVHRPTPEYIYPRARDQLTIQITTAREDVKQVTLVFWPRYETSADRQTHIPMKRSLRDPPYNVNYEGSAGKIKNDNMADEAFYTFLLDAYTQMHAAMADDASIYVFHADTEGLNFRRAFADAGFYLSGCCIWKKQSLVLGRSPYQWQHEPLSRRKPPLSA